MQTEVEMLTDDEALREAGMSDGPKKIGKFKLRPLSAESLAWSQTVGIFDDEIGEIHRIAGYVFLHTEHVEDILPVVFKKDRFWRSVSVWMREKINHHGELKPYDEEMNEAWERYNAATTKAANPSHSNGPQPKN